MAWEPGGRYASPRAMADDLEVWLASDFERLQRTYAELRQIHEELERAHEALRRSQERYALAVRSSSDGLWDWDIRSGHLGYSPRFKALLGFADEEELPPRLEPILARMHPADAPRVKEALDRHFREHTPFEVEFRLRSGTGVYRWFHSRGEADWDETGNAVRMAGSLSDIHERKALEEDRWRIERRLASIGQVSAAVGMQLQPLLNAVSNDLDILEGDLIRIQPWLPSCHVTERRERGGCVATSSSTRPAGGRRPASRTVKSLRTATT